MSKAPIERQADKISSYFIPCILAMGVIVFVIWISLRSVGIVTSDLAPFPFAMSFAITGECSYYCKVWYWRLTFPFNPSVLVVACPCALGLAAPNAIIIGTGVAAKLGILFKGGEPIEACRSLDTMCFDKTGTLTTGVLSVTDIKLLYPGDGLSEEQMMFYAGSIEQSKLLPFFQRQYVSNSCNNLFR